MKRYISVALAIIILLISGCSEQDDSQYTAINFYYKTESISFDSDSGVITSESRQIRGNADDYNELLIQYLNGARKRGCVSPFPAGTTLEEFSLNETEAIVVLSSHLSLLTDYDLMVACVCLAKTVFDFTDVKTVQIRSLHNYLNGEPSIIIERDGYVQWDPSYSHD